jgi:hypothetical protein
MWLHALNMSDFKCALSYASRPAEANSVTGPPCQCDKRWLVLITLRRGGAIIKFGEVRFIMKRGWMGLCLLLASVPQKGNGRLHRARRRVITLKTAIKHGFCCCLTDGTSKAGREFSVHVGHYLYISLILSLCSGLPDKHKMHNCRITSLFVKHILEFHMAWVK